jgi:hypothetical protein
MAVAYTNKEFLAKLNLLHNGNLNFSVLSEYKTDSTILLVEDKYGQYNMKGKSLLLGYKPTIKAALNRTDNAVQRFRKVHGDRYDYSEFIYDKAQEKAIVICRKHGKFYMSPDCHIRGAGCKKCATEANVATQPNTKEKFIGLAKKIHSDYYTYDKVEYINAKTKVEVGCIYHGHFSLTPNNHLRGKGCPECANENATGWDLLGWQNSAEKSRYFDDYKCYFVRMFLDDESFYKIGRTYRLVKHRFLGIPYSYEVIHTVSHDDPKIIFDLENHLKRTFKAHKYKPLKPFGGQHECFKFDDPTIQSVLREMQIPSSSDIIPTSTK